jgi:hypothetical protein
MAELDTAFNDLNLSQSKPPAVFNQAIPQFTIQYPFWNQNMQRLLMQKQQMPGQVGDQFMKYSVDTWGLRNSETGEHEPFYLLCDHSQRMPTRNGGQICAGCGWFCMKTQDDQVQLETGCRHPREYSIFNTRKQLQMCGQCNKMVKFGCNINNM